jgi:hypothetical protein
MPFSSVLGANSVVKPGVCTSTTRPSVPYTGQLIYETDTRRIAAWNGSAWIYETAADGPPGLVLVRSETTFSAASSITADSVFNSTYQNYLITIRYITSTTGAMNMRLRASGTSAATNYNWIQLYALSGTTANAVATSQTSWFIGGDANGSIFQSVQLYVNAPNLAEPTTFTSLNARANTAYTGVQANYIIGNHTTATSYDGFEIIIGSGTATGNYTVYGYQK